MEDTPAPFFNCLIQNGDLGGEVELINLPLIFVVYCSNYNGAPVKMVSLSTVSPPPVESETLHGRLEKGAGGVSLVALERLVAYHWLVLCPGGSCGLCRSCGPGGIGGPGVTGCVGGSFSPGWSWGPSP